MSMDRCKGYVVFVPDEQLENLGMISVFPVSNQTNLNATMMGGWMLSIPESSANKELAWELLTILLEPEALAPMLHDLDIFQHKNQ